MKKSLLLLIIILLFPIGIQVHAQDDQLIPNSVSGVLIESTSGKILFEKEKEKEVSVASLTKMVVQIIILEEIESGNIKWDDIVTVSRNASGMGGSQIYLEEGEKMSVKDLMKGISVASGNDATVAMAEYISGSEEKFVQRMNTIIKKLGLKHTHFVNCTGLDEDNHYSSAYDMALIARELVLNHPDIFTFSSIYEDYLRKDTDRKFWLVNTNKLISQYDGVDGLKTGHTDNAGYCLAATIQKNGMRLIGIVLGEQDSKVRNQETISLLEYGFQNVKMNILKKKGDSIKTLYFDDTSPRKVNVVLKDDLSVLENIDANDKYTYDIELDKISFPLKAGDIVGKIRVKRNHDIVSVGKLVSSSNVSRLSFLSLFFDNFFHFFFGIF